MNQRAEPRSTRPRRAPRNLHDLDAIGIAGRSFERVSSSEDFEGRDGSLLQSGGLAVLPRRIPANAFICPPLVILSKDVFVVQPKAGLDLELKPRRVPPYDTMTAAFGLMRTRFY